MTLILFFNDTATTEIYTLSLHDALPICRGEGPNSEDEPGPATLRARIAPPRSVQGFAPAPTRARTQATRGNLGGAQEQDRKSTRLNSSHANISYAVFCLKKKKIYTIPIS